VPYPKDLHSLVNSYIEQYKPTEWLFNGQYSTNEKPTQYTDRSVNSFLKQIAEKTGINLKSVHYSIKQTRLKLKKKLLE